VDELEEDDPGAPKRHGAGGRARPDNLDLLLVALLASRRRRSTERQRDRRPRERLDGRPAGQDLLHGLAEDIRRDEGRRPRAHGRARAFGVVESACELIELITWKRARRSHDCELQFTNPTR
jgi:hypothetical protein